MFRHRGPYKPIYGVDSWKEMLANNWKEGVFEGVPYGFTSPAIDGYRQQCFLMESCPSAFVLASIAPERAKQEMLTLLNFLNSDGSPPMVTYFLQDSWLRRAFEYIFWRCHVLREPPKSFLVQPPGHAESVWEIYKQTDDKNFLIETAPKLKKVYRFFRDHRDPDKDGLVSIIHPLESMTDSLPEFDEALYGKFGRLPLAHFIINYSLYRKYKKNEWSHAKALKLFDFESAMFNTIYALNLEALALILKEIGDKDADEFQKLSEYVTSALVDKCFDKDLGYFVSLFGGENEKKTTIASISSVLPIALDLPADIVAQLVKNLSDTDKFMTNYPVPSVARDEPSYSPSHPTYLWRGTSWVVTNWYVVRGLVRHGYMDLAREITKQTYEMVKKYGFREYYNPETGSGAGDHEDSWSALIFDMIKITDLKI